MRATTIRVLLALACVSIGIPAMPPTSAHSSMRSDADSAAAVAIELSELEAAGDFNTLYDRIHPDAHAVVPRAAAVGWFENEYAPLGPSASTVTGVRFVEWTWQVTGVTYPFVAEVSYRQPFGDGSVVEDVVRLVQDRFGEWRWFFGRDRAFVDEQIRRYASYAPPPIVAGNGGLVEVVASDLDAFWDRAFAAEPQRYASPSVLPFDGGISSGCGFASADFGPFYCSADRTIYLEAGFMNYAEVQIGDFAAAYVVAHEWGHHVQNLRDLAASESPDGFGELYSLEFELMADCYAGVWTLDADTRGILDSGDVEEAILLAVQIGDQPGTDSRDANAHGTNAQRVKAFLDGYFDGISACEEGVSVGRTSPPEREAPSESAPSVADVLPSVRDVPPGLVVVDDVQRSLGEVAANYTEPADTEARFRGWGWDGNAARTFAPDGSGASEISSVYVSVHLFDGRASARAALDFSLTNQAQSTGASEIDVRSMGDQSRGLWVTSEDWTEATVYTREGPFLIRVTTSTLQGDPTGYAEDIAEQIVADAR